MADGVIHRCTKECPYNKKCFVCKTETEVSGNVVVLHKCAVTKEDNSDSDRKSRKCLCFMMGRTVNLIIGLACKDSH